MTEFDWHWHAASGSPRGCILVCHGMAEHHHRYTELAHYLNGHGWHVLTYDHPGHGADCRHPGDPGPDGWQAMTDRLTTMLERAEEKAGELRLWMLGHSMGSFLVLDYASRMPLPANCRGLILVGSNSPLWGQKLLLSAATRSLRARFGREHISPLLNRLTFGDFNKNFAPNRTESDWICSDQAVVDEYIQDAACGFGCSVGLWHDLSRVLWRLSDKATLAAIPKQLEILMLAGGQDPVGRFSKGPRALARRLRQHGPGAELKLYPTLRHEILNETDKRLVWADLQRMVSDFTPR